MNALGLAILGYVALQLVIGVVAARGIRSEDDYLLAGRRVGLLLGSFSVFATWFGAETCVGAAGQIFEHGLGPWSVEPFAYGAALVLVGLTVAVPLWRHGVTTFADFLRTRFSGGVERAAALLMIPGALLWAAAQIRAFAQVLSTATGLDLGTTLVLAGVAAVVYTAVGGLMADIVTDFVQGIVLVVGLIALTWAVVDHVGGLEPALAVSAARAAPRYAPGTLDLVEAWLIPIGGSLVSQEVLARTLAARSPAVARSSALVGGGMYLAVGLMPVFLGLVGASLVPDLGDGEQLLPRLARERLGPVMFVVFSGALVSAILSTVDSALLVAGSLLVRNVMPRASSERARLLAARASVLGFGLIALALAASSEGVFDLVEQASGFGSAGVLVVLLSGLFGRRGGPTSALLAMAAGTVSWIVLRYVVTDFPWPYLVSLAASALAFVAGLGAGAGAQGEGDGSGSAEGRAGGAGRA